MAVPMEERGTVWSIPALTDAEFTRFRRLILQETGINLRDTKRHLLVARLIQRLRHLGLDTFSAYYEYIVGDRSGQELITMINRITTHKTSFFREPHHFDFLAGRVIPEIRAQGGNKLRIWSAGCSSGEEPYSIAMTVVDTLGAACVNWDVRILATDIDTEMVALGESGIYPLQAIAPIPERLQRACFLRGYGEWNGMVQVRPELRRMIEFRRLNLTDSVWPVQSRFDVVFCRNVIIYFDRPVQQSIVERLAGCLRPGGYFFSGHSENLHWLRDLMLPVEATVYQLRTGESA